MGSYIPHLNWQLKFSRQVRQTCAGVVRPNSNSTRVVASWNTGLSTGKSGTLKSTGERKPYSSFIAHFTKVISCNHPIYQALAAMSVEFFPISPRAENWCQRIKPPYPVFRIQGLFCPP